MSTLRVIWRPKQIYPYESAWGLLHKLCRWNGIHFVDVWKLLAVGRGDPRAEVFLRRDTSLLDPTWLDRSELALLLNLSKSSIQDAFLDRYVCVSALQDLRAWGVPGLRFCAQCLGNGFHSPLHQLPFLTECPIHLCPLQAACPKCTRSIRYSAPTADAFSCSCGHPFWDGRTTCALAPADEMILGATANWIDRLGRGSFGPVEKRCAKSDAPAYSEASKTWVFEEYLALRAGIRKELRAFIDSPTSTASRCRDRLISRRIVAFFAWRRFWEGRHNGQSGGDANLSSAVNSRFGAIFQETLEPLSRTKLKRLVRGAAIGTFSELWEIASGSENYVRAGRLGDQLKGTYIPRWIAWRKEAPAPYNWRGNFMGPVPLKLEDVIDADFTAL